MTTAGINPTPAVLASVRPEIRSIRLLAARELRDSLSNRWFLLYSLAFAALALAMSFLSLVGSGSSGLAGFGRTAAGLVNLVMLIVPLMALTAGAGTIATERERGMLVYMLAQPVSRLEVLAGKFLGVAIALAASLALGFGVSALVMGLKGGAADLTGFLSLVGLTYMLALAMLSVGMLISAAARRSGVAIGISIFAWLTLAFLSDLGLMAGTLAFKLRAEELFGLALLNPLQAFKLSAMYSIHASLDILGPAGLYASQTFGERLPFLLGAALAAWIVLPLGLAAGIFSRRSPL